jgi:Type IV secretion system pilin
MFSKLIKIISAASLFLVLGVAMTATLTVSAATGDACANGAGTINASGQCVANNTATANGTGSGLVPPSTVICAANGGKCPITSNAAALTNQQGITALILSIARFLSYISVAIAVLVIIYGGYLYLNPTDSKGAETGQKVLVNAAIGLAVSITAVTIVSILSNILTGSYF